MGCGPHLAAGSLVGLFLPAPSFHRTWSAAQLHNRRSPAYVNEFIQLLAKCPSRAAFQDAKSSVPTHFAA